MAVKGRMRPYRVNFTYPKTEQCPDGIKANHVFDHQDVAERKDRVALVRKWTGGAGADIACDFVGFPQVIPEGLDMLRAGGTYLEIGTISRGAKIDFEPAQLVWGAKKIVGVIIGIVTCRRRCHQFAPSMEAAS